MARCDYCGNYEEGHQTFNGEQLPRGWVQVRKGLFKVLWFCSRKCKDDAGE
jgi:ribosomal protein L24E